MHHSLDRHVGSSHYREVFDAVTLSFVDKDIERAFRADYFASSLWQIRLVFFFGFFLYGIFGILDGHVIPEAKEAAWFIRYALVCPLLAAGIGFSYSKHFQKYFEPTATFLGAVAGVGLIAMMALANPPGSYMYYAGLLLCSVFYFSFMRLPFITATCLAWTIFAVYEIVALGFTEIPPAYFINNTVFLFTFIMSGMLICYSAEKYRRSDFLRRTSTEEQTEQLKNALENLQEMVQEKQELSRDPLTNLYSRTYFLSVAEFECNKYSRYGHQFSILLLDIDNLQLIRDSFGDILTESAVLSVAQKTTAQLRPCDVPCRFHDEGFAILLPETSPEIAEMLGKRLRQQINQSSILTDKGPLSITVSTGSAGVRSATDNCLSIIISDASKSLLQAKQREGRVSSLDLAENLRSAS